MLRRARHALRVYRQSLGAHLRSVLEYDADFWILVVAGMFGQLLNLAFFSVVFTKVQAINGWTFAECLLIAGLFGLIQGFGPLFYDGIWGLAGRINGGNLDYALVRPAPVPAQVVGSNVGMHGVGDVLVAGGMVTWALTRLDVSWTLGAVVISLLLLISAIAVHLSIVTVSNVASFWISGPHPFFAVALSEVQAMGRYPISVFGTTIKGAFTFVLPIGFVNFFPASWLLGKDQAWIGLLTPLVAIYCVFMARTMFKIGLRRYDSAGH